MFDQDCKQDEVFEEVARGVIDKYVHHVKVLTESLRQKYIIQSENLALPKLPGIWHTYSKLEITVIIRHVHGQDDSQVKVCCQKNLLTGCIGFY